MPTRQRPPPTVQKIPTISQTNNISIYSPPITQFAANTNSATSQSSFLNGSGRYLIPIAFHKPYKKWVRAGTAAAIPRIPINCLAVSGSI
jgi:hypothetical protein